MLETHTPSLTGDPMLRPGAVAMVASFTGMFIGQAVRTRMQPDVFRRWFLIAMILLGFYLAGSALVKIHG